MASTNRPFSHDRKGPWDEENAGRSNLQPWFCRQRRLILLIQPPPGRVFATGRGPGIPFAAGENPSLISAPTNRSTNHPRPDRLVRGVGCSAAYNCPKGCRTAHPLTGSQEAREGNVTWGPRRDFRTLLQVLTALGISLPRSATWVSVVQDIKLGDRSEQPSSGVARVPQSRCLVAILTCLS